jgi:hypothetical protein
VVVKGVEGCKGRDTRSMGVRTCLRKRRAESSSAAATIVVSTSGRRDEEKDGMKKKGHGFYSKNLIMPKKNKKGHMPAAIIR